MSGDYVSPGFNKASGIVGEIEQWEEADVTFVIAALLYHLADECDCTIRDLGQEMLSNMEFYWALEGGNLAQPPRRGGG